MPQSEVHNCAVTAVIPTRNRAGRVARLLDSLAEVRTKQLSWEVVVVDNGSTDGTAETVRAAAGRVPAPLRYISEPEPGLHACRHRGAKEARGEVIAYLDDDTQVHREWLRGAEPVLAGLAGAVVCRILPQWEAPVPSWLEDLVSTGVYGPLTLLDLGGEQREVEVSFVWGAGFFVRRSLVFELGGFHPDSMPAGLLRFRGDGEAGLMRKFEAAGHHAWYDPSSVVEHAVSAERMTHAYLRERFYRQGISESFTELREELHLRAGLVPEAEPFERSPATNDALRAGGPSGLLRLARRRMDAGYRRGRNWVSSSLAASRRSRLRFDEDMGAAFLRGRDYHRRATQADAGVRAWVRQPHYMGVSLAGFCSSAGPDDLEDTERTKS